MLTHPFIHPSVPGGALMGRPAPMVRPAPMAVRPVNPILGQRAEVALGLQRQRALAQALRGGTPSGVPQSPVSPGITRPAGIPQVR
jgi:hypothetical protein